MTLNTVTFLFILTAASLSGCSTSRGSSRGGGNPGAEKASRPLSESERRSPVYNIPDRPGPHTVNALLYGQKADQYRQEATMHHSMKQLYQNDPEMTAHCEKLIIQFSDLAAEYAAISKLHEKKAEEFNEPLLKELRK